MGVPQSNGVLRTKLSDMKIGDYILCEYNGKIIGLSNENLVFRFGSDCSAIGEDENLINPANISPGIASNIKFYAIKVDTGFLIGDRIISVIVSAQDLNKAGLLTGREFKIATGQSNNFIARSLSRAEFLKYISNSDLNGSITKASPNVWHGKVNPGDCNMQYTVVYQEINQDRIGDKVVTSLFLDGKTYSPVYNAYWPQAGISAIIQQDYTTSSIVVQQYSSGSCNCFRPCFEYVDNAKSTNLYY